MEERFPDIVDMKFTARMEEKLDTVEEGKTAWKDVIRDFYGGFERDLENAEKALEGVRLKVPDEVSEEKCDVCGRNMVIKSGRFGRFLACPGYPECTFTKPLVIEMPGRCPKCGGIVKPDVVLYEEGLDEEVLSGAVNAIRHADTLIIGGTSLVVYPAAGLIRYFRGRHLVVINMQPTGADAQADLCIAKPIGQVLSEDVLLED